jgi:hypothetical protein
VLVLAASLVGCAKQPTVAELPGATETMARVGRRLSGSLSIQELTALAEHGDRLLDHLTLQERAALAQGALRFRVDRPVEVDVATPADAVPFWLEDLGFQQSVHSLRVAGTDWRLFHKRFPAGWVGLGVNGLDRKPKAHYLVFVRSAQPSPTLELDGLDPNAWRIVRARDGASAAFDVDRPIGPLPDRVRGSLLLQPANDRRHATMLARSRVWKTHSVSGTKPDQIAVALGPDPAHSLVFTWRTDPSIRTARVRLASAEGATGLPLLFEGDSHLVESPGLLNDPIIRRHRVAANGLDPDTTYAYSLGDGSPHGWTPWYSIQTGPARPRTFQFLYMGDPQCGLEEWGRLLASARQRHPGAAFLLIAGDLVDRGNERTNWDHFFLRAAGVFERVPLMPCVGNHEYLDQGPRLYRSYFELPANGPAGIDSSLVYAFEYGNAFIAVLDSTLALADAGAMRNQAQWLDVALARTKAAWKFVMFHHPVYASHPKRESPALGAEWVPVFDKHHVDVVLQGHDHAYLRTYALRAGQPVTRADQGTTYVVSVAGTKYYGQRARPEMAVGMTELSTYQTIDIEVPADRLVYRAWDGEGREVDRFTIDKSAPMARIAIRRGSP